MKIKELFDSRDKKKRLSHIRNLIALACSDDKFDEAEGEAIYQIGIQSGLTEEEINRIFTRPDSIKFYKPESDLERIEQLYDMVLVMMVDGEIHDNEIHICKSIAVMLGFDPEIIGTMVFHVIEGIKNNTAPDVFISELMGKLF